MQDRVTDLGSTRRRPVQGITAQRRTRKIGSENELSLFRGRARGRRPGVAPGCRHLQAQQRGQNPVGRPARERNLPLAGAVLVDGTEKKDDSAPVRESGQKRISGLGRSPRELAATGGRRNQPGRRWRCARQTGTRPEDCHQDEKDRSDAAVTPSNCRRLHLPQGDRLSPRGRRSGSRVRTREKPPSVCRRPVVSYNGRKGPIVSCGRPIRRQPARTSIRRASARQRGPASCHREISGGRPPGALERREKGAS